LEAKIALRLLLESTHAPRLAAPPAQIRYRSAMFLHRLESLPVELRAAPSIHHERGDEPRPPARARAAVASLSPAVVFARARSPIVTAGQSL